MSNETLTLKLNGEIPLDLFARAVTQFSGLIGALSDEVADEEPVEWHIAHLSSGSAVIDVRPYSDDIEAVDRIVRAYDEIAEALNRREPVPFSQTVAGYAYGLTALLNGKITSLSMLTRFNQFTISQPAPDGERAENQAAAHRPSYGELRGEVGAIVRRPRVQMTVYDELFDRGIPCYLDKTWSDKVSQFWGKQIAVTGLIYRDELTDRPYKVRGVVNVHILRPSAGNFRRARGAIPWQPGDEPAEVTIRRLRDESDEI